MKKKLLTLLMLGTITASLVACGGKTETEAPPTTETVTETQESTVPTESETATEATNIKEVSKISLTTTKESYTYTDHKLFKINDTTDSLIVYFDYTNLDNEQRAAVNNIDIKAYQNDTECKSTYSMSVDEYYNSCRLIDNGDTIRICVIFEVQDLKNNVKIIASDTTESKSMSQQQTLEIANLMVNGNSFYGNNDFFNIEDNKKLVKNYLNSFDIQSIKNIANQYIEENSPKKSDTVYKILESISPIEEICEKFSIIRDEFSGDENIFYAGLTEINSNACVVPYSDHGRIYYKLGFITNDWLFADHAIIKYGDKDGDTIYMLCDSGAREGIRDVLDGGSVLEIAISQIYDDEESEKLVYITDYSEAAIRFYGEDDKTYDHVLTEVEKEALKAFSIYNIAINEFNKLIDNH